MEKMSYLLLFTFFHWLIFPLSLSLGFLIFSQPLKKFHVVLPTNSSLSSALALCRSFSRWPSAHFIFSLYSKISAFRFRLFELHLGCHTCCLNYFTLVCLWCGRTVGRTHGHVITKISYPWISYKLSYPWCSASRAWSSAMRQFNCGKVSDYT